MNRLTVIIPSRTQAKQAEFLKDALSSIAGQTVAHLFDIRVVLGVDAGCAVELPRIGTLAVDCIPSQGASQAAALNTAMRDVASGYVAFLEDDDQWMPDYLLYAVQAISLCDFVSSTQLEVDETGEVLRINDFPTPSGWFMQSALLRKVGAFNETYRFHLDNEWLGRLSETRARRIHLVESTAPGQRRHMAARPWLANLVDQCAGLCRVARHGSPYPLVRRRVHARSGVGQLTRDPVLGARSRAEHDALVRRFGRVPW